MGQYRYVCEIVPLWRGVFDQSRSIGMSVHVEQSRADALARRRSASVKAAATRKRRAEMLASMAPDSPLRGSAPVDGDIGRTLARIRAHIAGQS